jgi:hypothetical protein
MVDQIGNEIPVPSFTRGGTVANDEVLYSYARFTQKGVTLLKDQGILYTGTVLARQTSTKKYVKYASGGSDGANVAVGILRKTVDTTGEDKLGNIIISGILKREKVSSANGGITAVVSAFTGSRDSAALGTFTF